MPVFKDLEYYGDLIYDNEESFLKEFCTCKDVMILVSVSWSSCTMHFVYIKDSGQHISDSASVDKFIDWVKRVKGKLR
jgi:hypothetical protein